MASDFDERARTWDDDPGKLHRAKVVAEAIDAAVPLGPSTRLLEYGTGTGLLSQELAARVGQITLAEPSAGMRTVIAEKIAAGRLPTDTRVWDLDLGQGAPPSEEFDLIASVMVLHHIPDLTPVLEGFAALLADGGHLCVVDLEEEDGSFHRAHLEFDGHNGFARDDLRTRLERAGFADVRFSHCHEIEKEHGTYPLFLATCTLPPG